MDKKIVWVLLGIGIMIVLWFLIIRPLLILREAKTSTSDIIYLYEADKTKDISYCYKIKGEDRKIRCFEDVAILTKNQEICANIDSTDEQIRCLFAVKGDYSFCETDEDKDGCYYHMAWLTLEVGLCEKSGKWKYHCYDYIAEKTENPDICINFLEEDSKKYCVAIAKRDDGYCEQIVDINRRDMCYSNIVKLNGDSLLCENIISEGFKDMCYTSAAEYHSDRSLCLKVSNQFQKDICYEVIEKKASF